MGIPRSYPMRFTPKGIHDAYDATDTFPGACRQLADLIFDPSNPEFVISRPGVTQISPFTGFSTPGFVSVHVTLGTRIYGMIASAKNAGKDEPFCYDTATAAFVAFTGVTGANSPTSPATSGPWTPPTMAQMGVYLVVTHPGFPGTSSHFFGVMDLTNPAAPAWSSVNLTTNALTAVPRAVANQNNRLYFAVGNQLQYTDVLTLVRTNASQALTIGDSTNIMALSGLPVQTTSSGVIAALMVLKGTQVWQVTGDTATTDLALNYLSLSIGTQSPRSVAQSPMGVYFAGADAPYVIDQLGGVHQVTHSGREIEADIKAPFVSVTEPTRVAGAYTASIYRVCLPTIFQGNISNYDLWFDERRRRWNGPHTFAYDCGSALGNYFVLTSSANSAKLIKSQVIQDISSVFNDLSVPITGVLQSATFPKTGRMAQKQVVESTQELSSAGSAVLYDITAQDEVGNPLGNVALNVPAAGVIWGSNQWGDGSVWASSQKPARVYSLPWSMPLVFQKMALFIAAQASGSVLIGTHYARYQDTGYVNAPRT